MTSLCVLHVVPHLDRVGGYERQALALARVQNRRPDTAVILLTHEAPGRAATETTEVGTVVRLPRGLRRHHPATWWRSHGGRVDVVHAHAMHKLSGQVVALARSAGVPSVVKVATGDDVTMFAAPERWRQVLDGDDRPPGGLRWRRMMRASFRQLSRADRFLALNDEIAAELRRHGLPGVPMDNGVDTTRLRPATADERRAARDALGLDEQDFVVVGVGRLTARKGQDVLVDAFARLAAREPRARLLLVGDGPRRQALQTRVAEVGLAARAIVTGELADVRPALWAADVFAHPSSREGQPNAVLEAWACGLPCALSDIPAHRQLAAGPPRRALLALAGDVEALARALEQLHAEADLRTTLADRARRRAADVHALPVVAERLRALYAELRARGVDGPMRQARSEA